MLLFTVQIYTFQYKSAMHGHRYVQSVRSINDVIYVYLIAYREATETPLLTTLVNAPELPQSCPKLSSQRAHDTIKSLLPQNDVAST